MTCAVLADICFEISFEVCNKVGGIYTVVSSKAKHMMEKYDQYFLLGPYFENKAIDEFEPMEIPFEFSRICELLRKEGIKVYFGKWNIKGRPNVFLFDYKDYFRRENELKSYFWEKYGIDSYGKGYDFCEPVIFSVACARFLEEFQKITRFKRIILHCHEWMTGFAGLYLKEKKVPIATVFTTHATMIGRTMSSYNFNLYSNLDKINPKDEAYKANVHEKHLTEHACANNFDVFTTVSQITSLECERLFLKKPDIVLLNGLDMDEFPTFEEASIKHKLVKDVIRTFNAYFFGPYQNVEFDNSLFFYTSGRYEFKNKGIDILIQSLGKLNEILKKDPKSRTIYVYFLVPNGTNGIKNQISSNKNKLFEIKEQIRRSMASVEFNILRETVNNQEVKVDSILTSEEIRELERLKREFHIKYQNPFSTTHNVCDEAHNAVMDSFLLNNLMNSQEDKVKVIYCPIYLDVNDGLFNLHYYEFVSGCHLGIFASYYEPFGYTPFESIALSVPSITSDLAGFGRFIMENKLDGEGAFVIPRMNISIDESVDKLCDMMKKYIYWDKNSRVEQKIKARKTATLLDWAVLIDNYIESHNLALTRQKLI